MLLIFKEIFSQLNSNTKQHKMKFKKKNFIHVLLLLTIYL